MEKSKKKVTLGNKWLWLFYLLVVAVDLNEGCLQMSICRKGLAAGVPAHPQHLSLLTELSIYEQ